MAGVSRQTISLIERGDPMFTFFNSESLWIGTDMKRFHEIRDCLDTAGIPYKHKVKNHSAQWTGRGTLRGNMGSLGISADQMYQYEIFVYRKDLEKARHAVNL